LADSNGDIVASDDDSGNNLQAYIDCFNVQTAGVYYLIVKAYQSQSGNYILSWTKGCPVWVTTTTTADPTTEEPTTEGPTTEGPTTEGPTTEGPTTEGPTTSGPTTSGPTTPPPPGGGSGCDTEVSYIDENDHMYCGQVCERDAGGSALPPPEIGAFVEFCGDAGTPLTDAQIMSTPELSIVKGSWTLIVVDVIRVARGCETSNAWVVLGCNSGFPASCLPCSSTTTTLTTEDPSTTTTDTETTDSPI